MKNKHISAITFQKITKMKSYYCLFLICLLFLGNLTAIRANNPVKEKTELTAIEQMAVKMVQKWTKDVQLTTEQQSQLLKRTIEYLMEKTVKPTP